MKMDLQACNAIKHLLKIQCDPEMNWAQPKAVLMLPEGHSRYV